jgi:hypothetical protein
MKVILRCNQIGDITKCLNKEPYTIDINIEAIGQVQNVSAFGKEASLHGKLSLKPKMAEQLKIGQSLIITIEAIDDNF